MIPQSKIDAFWARVDKSGDCWIWTGPTNVHGYGVVSGFGKNKGAHRVAYLLGHGEIPEGAFICHHCDVAGCVRGSHLYAGNARTNNWDRFDRGTFENYPRGALHPSKFAAHPKQLTRAALASIQLWRDARADLGLTQAGLARALGCREMAVSRAERGATIPRPALVDRLHALLDQSRALRASLPAGERDHSTHT